MSHKKERKHEKKALKRREKEDKKDRRRDKKDKKDKKEKIHLPPILTPPFNFEQLIPQRLSLQQSALPQPQQGAAIVRGTLNRALLIGINYTGTINELNGCINDTENLSAKLIEQGLYKKEEMIFMNDKLINTSFYPSKVNILAQLEALVQLALKNPSSQIRFFLAYSGHGSYLKDKNGDEADGRDEAICPIDCMENGFIIDDDLNRLFIQKLPSNVKLVVMSDSCHSGTVLDLKYNYKIDSKNSCLVYGNYAEPKADVILISGCRDDQTSADAYLYDPKDHKYEYQGAMTGSFLANYRKGISSYDLLKSMRTWLSQKKYSQSVQLSSGKALNTMSPFPL